MSLVVGILKTDVAHHLIQGCGGGDYDQMMLNWLRQVAPDLSIRTFDCVAGEFPSAEAIDAVAGFIITGSKHSAYETVEWIQQLKACVADLDRRRKPVLGICFGHQILAEALGGRVIKNPKGWEVSHSTFALTDSGRSVLGTDKPALCMLQMHQDVVSDVPPGMEVIASNDFGVEMMRKDNHILSIQGHPEFSAAVIRKILELREGVIPEPLRQHGLAVVDSPTDARWFASVALAFFRRGGRPE
eukprot:gnl/Spiro4/6267_TR3228_c0_g1_i1.p2 gnl/Spiro4/6267_TR3228_c0_g1~~gnl/Spiro4/6267_TR3228_c0_g1_i1.p2  ORF type:complete len:254 (-),score=96.89 gnl/Spiro4/6267_TR3228_c0_g1_i1:70-801(-)